MTPRKHFTARLTSWHSGYAGQNPKYWTPTRASRYHISLRITDGGAANLDRPVDVFIDDPHTARSLAAELLGWADYKDKDAT